MEYIKSLFGFNTKKMDFISELPPEISQMIFRKLDPQSLLIMPQVSRLWYKLCASDPCLKKKAREYLKELKEQEEKEKQQMLDYLSDKENNPLIYHSCPECTAIHLGIPIIKKYEVTPVKRTKRSMNAKRLLRI